MNRPSLAQFALVGILTGLFCFVCGYNAGHVAGYDKAAIECKSEWQEYYNISQTVINQQKVYIDQLKLRDAKRAAANKLQPSE